VFRRRCRYEIVSAVHQVTPTGVAAAALLDLELADQPTVPAPDPSAAPTTRFRPVRPAEPELPGSAGEHFLQCVHQTTDRAERFYRDQVLDHLNEAMVAFVGRMEMAFVATADAHGECDASFRAGPPGFLHVLDPSRIAYPEYRGNGVMASLGNIKENPHVGLLLVDFTDDQIGLHVNGSAEIVADADLRAANPGVPAEVERGRTPEHWVVLTVAEAYIHCRKHIPRLAPVSRDRAWGTDDVRRKGGDYFGVKAARQEHPGPVPDGPAPRPAPMPAILPAR
jgi:uncharacterized protein